MRIGQQHWLYTRQIAHRGLHNAEHPENTAGAFERALQMGYAIETDIQLTKDGEVAVFHDKDLTRATGGKDKRNLADITMEELRQADLFGCDAVAPTLSELLKLVAGRVPLLLEFKTTVTDDNGALEKLAAEQLDAYPGEFAVQSFNPYVLLWFKRNRPQFLRGQLSSFFEGDIGMGALRKFVLKHMLFNGRTKPDFISYNLNDLPNQYVDKYVAKTGAPVLAWTVHCPHCLKSLNGHADNIIFEGFLPPKNWKS